MAPDTIAPAVLENSPKTIPPTPAPQFALGELLQFRVALLANLLERISSQALQSQFGLRITDWRVLAVIAGSPGISANEIAIRTATDKGWVSRSVTQLDRNGLIERTVDRQDSRRYRLTLTRRGRAIFDQAAAGALARQEELVGAMPADERARLMDSLQELIVQAKRLQQSPIFEA